MTSLFPANTHIVDRILRVVLGLGLFAPIATMGASAATGVAAAAGAVLLLTATIGSCPIYTVLGLSTRPKEA